MSPTVGLRNLAGEHGAGLSGGEKQRLSIARTLLYDPRILVLDEATSNIDAEAERSIQQALEVLIEGRTTVAIAHRLSTLRNADRILVFDRGTLAEQGSHAELLAADGIYARLVRMQTQVTKTPTVDHLIAVQKDTSLETIKREQAEEPLAEAGVPVSEPKAGNGDNKKNFIQWLDAHKTSFQRGAHGQLQAWRDGECLGQSVFALRTFPATHNDQYLSIRGWNESNEEVEIGMIRSLTSGPQRIVG